METVRGPKNSFDFERSYMNDGHTEKTNPRVHFLLQEMRQISWGGLRLQSSADPEMHEHDRIDKKKTLSHCDEGVSVYMSTDSLSPVNFRNIILSR